MENENTNQATATEEAAGVTTTSGAATLPAAEGAATTSVESTAAAKTETATTTTELQNKLNEMLAGLVTKTAQQQVAAPKKEDASATKTYTQAELDAALEAGKEPPKKEGAGDTDLLAEIEVLKMEVATSKMRDSALAEFAKAGVPAALAATLPYHDIEANAAAVKSLCERWKLDVDAGVMQRLGGKTPEGLGSSKTAETAVAAQITKNIRGE